MPEEGNEYIVEFVALGKAIKVTAIDAVTAKEVSMVGAPGVGKDKLAKLAIRKLRYVINKEAKKTTDS